MKKFASKSGFTLVELIVVIAILGILAGIAVPAYSGYIKKANTAKVYSELSIIQTAAQSVAIEDGQTVKTIEISNAGLITVTTTDNTYNMDESKIATYASNVTPDATAKTGTVTNWAQIYKGTDYNKATWNAATNSADAAWTLDKTA